MHLLALAPSLIPYRLGLLIAITGTLTSYAIGLVSEDALFVAFAAQLLFVSLAVPYWGGRPYLTGWDHVVVSIVAGACLRSYYFVTKRPSEAVIDFYFLRGQSALDLAGDAALYSLGIGLLGLGFWAGFRRQMAKSRTRSTELILSVDNPDYARVVCRLVGLASLIALYAFAEITGGIDWQNLSAKRAIRLHETSSTGFENILRAFSYVGIPAVLLHMGLRPVRGLLLWRLWNGLLFLLAILPAIYTSSRQELVLIPVALMAVQRLNGRRMKPWLLVPLAIAVLVLFTLVTDARTTRNDRGLQLLPGQVETLDAVAINRNMLGYTRLANLRVAKEAGRTEYQLGRTYVIPFLAPIPRALWESKPVISPGPRFAAEVYGSDSRGGIPPDGITELYWNFGLAGMLVLAPMLGAAIGALDGALQIRTRGNVKWFLYILGPFFLAFRVITISFAQALGEVMQTALVASIVFFLARGTVRLRRSLNESSSVS
jgi:glutaredoxin-related protein